MMLRAKTLAARRAPAEAKTSLSEREREVLHLLTRGLSNKEIGAKLDLSPFTVRNHLAHVFGKLRVRCRTEAVVAYLQAEHKLDQIISHQKDIK
jgi:DNA-binding NarL/FixJ family response regulator